MKDRIIDLLNKQIKNECLLCLQWGEEWRVLFEGRELYETFLKDILRADRNSYFSNPLPYPSPRRSVLTRDTGETSDSMFMAAGTFSKPSRHGIYPALWECHHPSTMHFHLHCYRLACLIPNATAQSVSQQDFSNWEIGGLILPGTWKVWSNQR